MKSQANKYREKPGNKTEEEILLLSGCKIIFDISSTQVSLGFSVSECNDDDRDIPAWDGNCLCIQPPCVLQPRVGQIFLHIKEKFSLTTQFYEVKTLVYLEQLREQHL